MSRRWAATLLLGLLVGCSSSPATPVLLPPPPSIVDVTVSEYHIRHAPKSVAGRAVIRARNVGKMVHQVLLVRLPDDVKGTLDEQLRSPTRRGVEGLYFVPSLPAGDDAAFAVDLAPGRYGFVCFLQDPDGLTHALKGMNSDLTVG